MLILKQVLVTQTNQVKIDLMNLYVNTQHYKKIRSEWEKFSKRCGTRDNLKKAIKEKSVFRAVKAVGLGSGKIILDGMKVVDSQLMSVQINLQKLE